MTYTSHTKRGAALVLLLGLLVAFFAPYAYLYAQENPPTPPQTEPAPTAPPADTPTEPTTPTTPTTPSTPVTPTNTTVSPNTGGQGGFVPLTSIPGVSEVTGADGVASFLNQLYRIAIGAAAVLAILQITRAGLMYMTEESISERKEARHIIMMAILGLVLVLSPAIVFGIIDPRILNLSVDLSGIQPTNPGAPSTLNVGNPLSTGNGITAGTRLSCLYPRQAPDAVAGLQGNRPATVLEDESVTEGSSIADGNNLLKVRFDDDPGVERYVAAGDCRAITAQTTPTPPLQELGGFRVGQTAYCEIRNDPQQPYRTVRIESIADGQWLAISCTGCSRILLSPDRCRADVPTDVCGTAPECNAGCEAVFSSSGEVCEPI